MHFAVSSTKSCLHPDPRRSVSRVSGCSASFLKLLAELSQQGLEARERIPSGCGYSLSIASIARRSLDADVIPAAQLDGFEQSLAVPEDPVVRQEVAGPRACAIAVTQDGHAVDGMQPLGLQDPGMHVDGLHDGVRVRLVHA